MQATLHGLVARRDVPHAILAVQSGDGSFRWIEAAGKANPDGSPMRPDTPFHIASIDKLYTATVIMKLYERRRDLSGTELADRVWSGPHALSAATPVHGHATDAYRDWPHRVYGFLALLLRGTRSPARWDGRPSDGRGHSLPGRAATPTRCRTGPVERIVLEAIRSRSNQPLQPTSGVEGPWRVVRSRCAARG